MHANAAVACSMGKYNAICMIGDEDISQPVCYVQRAMLWVCRATDGVVTLHGLYYMHGTAMRGHEARDGGSQSALSEEMQGGPLH